MNATPDSIVNIFNAADPDQFVRLDQHTWVRRSAVSMVTMGPDQETLIHVGGLEFDVNSPVTQVLRALGTETEA